MQDIIRKQLLSYPKFKKHARIGYFEEIPLKQVHIDTMFWQTAGELDVDVDQKSTLIPILCVVDVATRYTKYYPQKKKSDDIKSHLESFIKEMKQLYPDKTSSNMILVTDGAPEFKALKSFKLSGVNIKSHLSTGINKAVLAEVSIRKARVILREIEVLANVTNVLKNTNTRIEQSNIHEVFEMIEKQINAKAKIRKRKVVKVRQTPIPIGTPVFALNFYKFYPHQMKSNLQKQSYMTNYYYEPFEVVSYYGINGIYKYTLASYERTRPKLKYTFYEDQLQPINPDSAAEYIKMYHSKRNR